MEGIIFRKIYFVSRLSAITLNNTGVPYVEQELLKNYGATELTLFVFMRSALFKNIIAINCRFSGYKSVDWSNFEAGTAHPSGAPKFIPGFSEGCVTRSLVVCVMMFCRSLFVLLSFFDWPLYRLSFDYPLVSSNFSYCTSYQMWTLLKSYKTSKIAFNTYNFISTPLNTIEINVICFIFPRCLNCKAIRNDKRRSNNAGNIERAKIKT